MLSKKSYRVTAGWLPVVALMIMALDMGSAEAVPAFARQAAQPCTSCHYQHFPTLNSFGRMFKAQGYTMGGTQESIQGDGLDLPGTLNAALLGRLALEKGENQKRSIGYPASLSLYFGGRMGENSGFLMEMPFEGAETEGGEEVEGEGGAAFAQMGNLKWNYVTDLSGYNVGLHAFSTSMAGPAYGYELLSTGAMGMNVPVAGANAMGSIGMHMEHGSTLMGVIMDSMSGMDPSMMRMTMAGPATGTGATVQTGDFYVYYAAYAGAQAMDIIGEPKLANYLRLAWTPMLDGWNVGLGTQIYRGSFQIGVDGDEYDANATTFDLQVQGDLAGMPIGFYGSYAVAPKSTDTSTNWYNQATGDDNKSYGMLFEAGVADKLSVSLGYVKAMYNYDMMMNSMWMAQKVNATSTSLGANYLLAPNKRLGFKYVTFGGDIETKAAELDLVIGF